MVGPSSPCGGLGGGTGFARERARGAAAAVSRDENGKFLGSSTLVVNGITDVATLESIACREALFLAEDL